MAISRTNEEKKEKAASLRQSYHARKAYVKYHGSIPKGHDIHHRDRDRDNNNSENLEALTKSNHSKRHAFEDPSGWGWAGYHRDCFPRIIKKLELELYYYNNNIY